MNIGVQFKSCDGDGFRLFFLLFLIKKEKSREEKNESCTGSCNFIFSAHKISLYLLYYVLSTAYCIVSDRILSRRLDREKEK